MQAFVQTPTPDILKSKTFYRQLGYTDISDQLANGYSDGSVLVEINPDRYARAGLKLYKENWKSSIDALQLLTSVTTNNQGYVLSDFTGCYIYLVEGKFEIDVKHIPKNSAIPGNFSGLSLETTAMDKSKVIWQTLGFKQLQSGPNDNYVVLAEEGGMTVSLMKINTCPHLFFNPSMTYFNGGENLTVIEKIRTAQIPITEEITHFNDQGVVDNIIMRDPGGYGFFIFND